MNEYPRISALRKSELDQNLRGFVLNLKVQVPPWNKKLGFLVHAYELDGLKIRARKTKSMTKLKEFCCSFAVIYGGGRERK